MLGITQFLPHIYVIYSSILPSYMNPTFSCGVMSSTVLWLFWVISTWSVSLNCVATTKMANVSVVCCEHHSYTLLVHDHIYMRMVGPKCHRFLLLHPGCLNNNNNNNNNNGSMAKPRYQETLKMKLDFYQDFIGVW